MSTTRVHAGASSPPLLRVLILEDNPRDAKLTASMLEHGGYRAQSEITDSLEGFRERLEKAEYDVILAGFNLRNWTAFDALEILKKSGKDIPLIVVTGSLGDEGEAECIKRGAAAFVLKDRPARLLVAVDRALEERRLRAENMQAFQAIAWLAKIVESSDDAIIGETLEGVVTSWNKGAEKLYGYSADEVLGQHISVITPSDRVQEETVILVCFGRGATIQNFETVRVRKDGSPVDVSLSVFPLTDSQGAVTGAASIARDVTERKRAEVALQNEKAFSESIIDSLPDMFYIIDSGGRYVRWTRLRQSRIGGDEWEPEGGGELIGQRSQGRSRQEGEGRGRRGRDPEVGKSY